MAKAMARMGTPKAALIRLIAEFAADGESAEPVANRLELPAWHLTPARRQRLIRQGII
jgi:hypothetical protein